MKLSIFAVAIYALLSGPTPTLSQDTGTAPKKVLLAEGTEVRLRMAQDISSRAARPGEPIELVLAEDLKVGDATVAKVGARALGEVLHAKRPDFWGDPGEVSIRVRFLRVGDQKVGIRGTARAEGTVYVVIRGSQGIIKTGTPVTAFVSADTEVVPVPEAPPKKKLTP